MRLIHIVGPSGSGKTTLGKILAENKRYLVVDTDDVNDPHALELLAKLQPRTNAQHGKYKEKIETLDSEKFAKIIDDAGTQYDAVIIVGMIIDMPRVRKLIKRKDIEFSGYIIKVAPELIWQRINVRHFELISRHLNAIRSELKSSTNPYVSGELFLHKYELRRGFPTCMGSVLNNIDWINDNYKQKKYKTLPPEKIIQKINL